MLTPNLIRALLPPTGEVRPKIGLTAQTARGLPRMTSVGRDRPKSYGRGVDNALFPAKLLLQPGGLAVHMGNAGLG